MLGLNIWINSSIRARIERCRGVHEPTSANGLQCVEALDWGEKHFVEVFDWDWQCSYHPHTVMSAGGKREWSTDCNFMQVCKCLQDLCKTIANQKDLILVCVPQLESEELFPNNLILLNEKNLNPIVCFDSLFIEYLHIMNTNGIMSRVCARSK